MPSKPVLYYVPRSPPCRAVLLTAAALNIELDLRLISLREGEHLKPEFLKLNPLHTVPVLDDNGIIITDSHAICSYLATKYGTNETLYPKGLLQRLHVDSRLYYDCGHLFPRLRFMVEPVIYFGSDEISEEKIAYMQKAYDGLEHSLQKNSFLCGDHLTIADLCCISSVSSAMLFAPIDQKRFPRLRAWIDGMSRLPYYNKANREGVEILGKLVREKLAENKKRRDAVEMGC